MPTPLPCCPVSQPGLRAEQHRFRHVQQSEVGWIGAQLLLLLLTCSPRGVALATALVRVAGVALRHVAALVAAALGPRRCHPRHPAALIHIAAALVAPLLPLSPPPSTPRRRRPRRRRPRALDAAALDAAAHTAALHIQRCGSACTVTLYCERCAYGTVCACQSSPGSSLLLYACFRACRYGLKRTIKAPNN